MVGYRYANRYQATDVIGQDAICVVRRGRDLLMDRDVAIKVLRADLTQEPSVQTSFRQGAHHAAALNHPAFVAVYDTGDTPTDSGSVPFVVMEYVEGDTLRTVLDRQGPLPWRRALRIAAELCSAIDHAHRRNLLPCHITPANVLVDPHAGGHDGDRVKVIDIGQRTPLTASGVRATQYFSPEQIRGGLPDKRSDLYTVGCVMFEMLCGRTPFIGVTAETIADQHLREAPRAPSEYNRSVPRDVDAIVLTALNKNPVNRYANAEQMRVDIERALAGRAVHARRQFEPPAPATRRGPVAPPAERRATTSARPQPTLNAPLLAPGLTLPVLDEVEAIDPEREAAQRRRWTYVGLGGLALALVGALWLTLVVITTPPPPAKVAVPNVIGMTVSAATAALQDKELRLGAVTTVDTDKGPTGTIVNQRPSERTEVEAGTDVAVEIEG